MRVSCKTQASMPPLSMRVQITPGAQASDTSSQQNSSEDSNAQQFIARWQGWR